MSKEVVKSPLQFVPGDVLLEPVGSRSHGEGWIVLSVTRGDDDAQKYKFVILEEDRYKRAGFKAHTTVEFLTNSGIVVLQLRRSPAAAARWLIAFANMSDVGFDGKLIDFDFYTLMTIDELSLFYAWRVMQCE